MAERDGGGDRSGGLLTTKLHLPSLPPAGVVARSRLSDRLEERSAGGLVLVCAPAGFGKTVLLADWCRGQGRPVAWLSLDASDNDPTRFWRHCAAALEGVRPGMADLLIPSVDASSFEVVVTTVVNQLASEPEGGLLVLDDYHLIEAEVVHAAVRFLLENRPPGLDVVVASRADPPFPLARLRASGLLTEFRETDLRFTDEEATGLLGRTVDADLDTDAVAALVARTEGWAAGLQMAGLSLRGRPDIERFVASFSGSHRYVLDYLTEEVLDRQPEELRTFLLETSVLGRLSGPLCDAVTGRRDSQQLLEAIEATSLFLTPLDEVRGWWRYHQLFADLLRLRLSREHPDRIPQLHRNAGTWHTEHGPPDDAIGHAFAAGDATWAARLIERHTDELLMRRQDATVQRWVAALPTDVRASRPRLLLGQARAALFNGSLADAQGLLDAAERAHAAAAGENYTPMIDPAVSRVTNVPAALASQRAWCALLRGDPKATRRYVAQALAELGDQRGSAEMEANAYLAAADWLEGHLDDAERRLVTSIEGWRKVDDWNLASWGCTALGALMCDRGELHSALRCFRRGLAMAQTPGFPVQPALGQAHLGIAEVAYRRYDLDTALTEITTSVALCRRLTYSRSLAIALAVQARVMQAGGDGVGARRAMDEAAALSDPDVVDLQNPVPSQHARLAMDQGNAAVAERWVEQRGLTTADDPVYAHEPAYLVLTHLALVQGRPGRALGLLDRLHRRAIAQGRTGSCIEIQAQRALALEATGAETRALAALDDALTMAHPQGYARVFVDEGPAMARLLGRFIAAQDAETTTVDLSFLARLLQAFEPAAATSDRPASAVPTVVGLVTQLTEREVEVLRLLARGRRNDQIAAELFVALSTVKTHVTHILQKLGARNRTEATDRARDLGLLE